ncbi:MAG TPA: hypothetical protein VLE91_04890 [Candidatus Saccharimonadales bacterium]|nr:hypothetical protein [Candidatus Saccharimonadales bacterium]
MAKQGKLIVFEGIDGSGKTTQSTMLLKYLQSKKVPCAYVSFPRYEDSIWAQMVKKFLLGELGKLDPYTASMLYAGDRMSASPQISKWLADGKMVICNRYVGSNIGHMTAKLKTPAERRKYISWLEDLEYGENKIPKEDLVVLLQVPVTQTKRLMGGRQLDIHERDSAYQREVYKVYDEIAKIRKNWVAVDCTKNELFLTPDDIHKKILAVLSAKKVL